MDRITTILEEVFAQNIDWCASYEGDLIGCASIYSHQCVNIWVSKNKAMVMFINPTPYKDDLTMTMREYISCFYLYPNVEQVKKIKNRLVIKFR